MNSRTTPSNRQDAKETPRRQKEALTPLSLLGALATLLALSACGDGGSSTKSDETPQTEDIIKVTWLRFNYDPKTRRLTPMYYAMISSSWKMKYGQALREPLARLFPWTGKRPPIMGEVLDWEMKRLLGNMKSKGLEKLKWVKPEDLDLVKISQVERIPMTANPDDHVARSTRIITVGGDGWHRSYCYWDNTNHSNDDVQARMFSEVENEVAKQAAMSTAQVGVGTVPFDQNDKK